MSEKKTSADPQEPTDEKTDQPDNAPAPQPEETGPDPVRRITRWVFIVVALIFIWYLFADRITPSTDQARVQAYVIPIVPQVSGKLVEVNIDQNQLIERGTLLFTIDPADYLLNVEMAESDLELVGQEIGAGTATVVTAQAQLVEAETNLEHIKVQSARVFELEERNLLSKSDGDKARAAIKQARAQVKSAQANLEKAKQSLGPEGEANPKVRAAIAKLKQAQLDLSRTEVFAPSTGGITNLQVDIGYYASPGAPLMTFVDAGDLWIEANMKENNLANLEVGDKVEIALDIMPGQIYNGQVRSLGFAVASGSNDQIGGLASVESASGWLRDPQRFPVIISFDDEIPVGIRRIGGQADVQFYTNENVLLNAIAKVYIRVLSWLSYVY